MMNEEGEPVNARPASWSYLGLATSVTAVPAGSIGDAHFRSGTSL